MRAGTIDSVEKKCSRSANPRLYDSISSPLKYLVLWEALGSETGVGFARRFF